MDLDEAIKHCEEKAEELRRDSQKHNIWVAEQCIKCAEEHEQFAAWLTELKQLREKQSHKIVVSDPCDMNFFEPEKYMSKGGKEE